MGKKAVRRITAGTKDQIRRLVDVLYHFLPLSARGKDAVTFRSIFAESGREEWLEGHPSKRRALQAAWENVIRYHPRLPYRLIRKIVPAAIDYRRYKRNPLLQEELDALTEALLALDFYMRRELGEIELEEELPAITIPPKELVHRLEEHDLHDAVRTEPLQLFRDGHFNEAVRRAAERFEDALRDRSGLDDHGRTLMANAFRPDGGVLRLVNVEAENQRDFQEGFQFLAMGMIQAIRNVFSHGDEERRPPEECYEMLLFLNWLFRHLGLAET